MKNVRREEKAIKDFLYEQLLKREHWLRDLKQNLETSIQNAPLGNLKIINCRGIEQYYLDSAETRASYPNGKYLRKSDFELVGKLAQRNYDEKLLSEVEKQLKNIQNIMKKYAENYPIVATGVGEDLPEGYSSNPIDQLIPDIDFEEAAANRETVLSQWSERYDAKSAAKEQGVYI